MQEATIRSFTDLAALIEANKKQNWLYRGQASSKHAPMPKIGRPMGSSNYKYTLKNEKLLLKEFKRQARPLLSNGSLTELEWMAIAQHHGLSTRLLDWTESALIAAFFATESGLHHEVEKFDWEKSVILGKIYYPVIFGIRDLPAIKETEDPFKAKVVKMYRPSHISNRIAPQQAVFTIHPKPGQAFESTAITKWKLDIKDTADDLSP